jgi:hypothetical protein
MNNILLFYVQEDNLSPLFKPIFSKKCAEILAFNVKYQKINVLKRIF